jgi:carbamoyltransferase
MTKINKINRNRCARVILGINSAYHESAAAITIDGYVVAAVEEERFSGCKHGKPLRVDSAHYLPVAAIDYCLKEAGVTWQDLDAVAYSLDPALRKRQACIGTEGRYDDFGHPLGERMFQRSLARIPRILRGYTDARLHFVPHHGCHAWYALGTSSFEQAAILVMDGIGEGASISLGRGNRRQLQIQRQSLFPHSVGLAWEKVACFLGLTEYDACKVMALAGLHSAPHSDDTLAVQMQWCEEGLVVNPQIFDLEHPKDYSGLEQWFGCSRKEAAQDTAIRTRIAAALQRATEDILLAIANDLHKQTGEQALVYAGGVALNCRANADLAARGPFSQIHIGPAAHDAGTAIGAAWHVYTGITKLPVPDQASVEVAGCGPIPGIPSLGRAKSWQRQRTSGLSTVSRWLVEDGPIGWLDGRCEFGPRALGRRSLLASPLQRNIVERVNQLKGRLWFEPLALAVPLECAEDLFNIPIAGRGLTPYMLITVRPRPAWRGRLAHLLHADGTVRLQTVNRADHPRFHALILEIERLTAVPLLINTSFNPRGRPMPATTEQALLLADTLSIRHIVVDGECWSKAEQDIAVPTTTATPNQQPELAFVG